jgi:hypothetical protein
MSSAGALLDEVAAFVEGGAHVGGDRAEGLGDQAGDELGRAADAAGPGGLSGEGESVAQDCGDALATDDERAVVADIGDAPPVAVTDPG